MVDLLNLDLTFHIASSTSTMVTKRAAKKVAPRKKKDESGPSDPPVEVLPAPVN